MGSKWSSKQVLYRLVEMQDAGSDNLVFIWFVIDLATTKNLMLNRIWWLSERDSNQETIGSQSYRAEMNFK